MKREQFFKVMRREEEGYIPFEFCFCDSFQKEFRRRTGQTDYLSYYQMPVRFLMPEYIGTYPYQRFFEHPEELKIDFWGIGHKPGSVAHFTQYVCPLSKAQTVEEIAEFPFVDPVNDFDWDQFEKDMKEFQQKDIIVYGALANTIFELSWYLLGFENFIIALQERDPMADYVMDRILDIRLEFARRYASMGVDCLHLGDDVSTQLDMMMSPDLWRETIKPRLRRVIETAQAIKPNMLMDYHGDGNLQKIIPDLIEIGVDILNPVQPECMDPIEIKRMYGDRLSFRGGLGTQTTLPFGTPEEVTRVCEELCREMGKGGGFMLCPTHMIEPEVPWENFEAYYAVVMRHQIKN